MCDPKHAGGSWGILLAQQICALARNAGYHQICLDTLPSMLAARQLYDKLGFRPVGPYVYNPIDGVIFLGLDL
jgi:ribosomal protein S18 acetylase RimI-like enzyme